jgi:hypothetical protein
MKFSLVFENSGDTIPFETVANEELLEFFVNHANNQEQNSFSNNYCLSNTVLKRVAELQTALSLTNEVMYDLVGQNFKQPESAGELLNQDFLNQQHAKWVKSQQLTVPVHELRFSSQTGTARLGQKLHDLYPDDITEVKLAEAMTKLGYIFPYEEVNMTVHRLERVFTKENLIYDADGKWMVFDNPFVDTIVSNPSTVNFSFGYTYVGRQSYDKFEHFDIDLKFDDHYNFEVLEFSFAVSLQNPETKQFSPEFLSWCNRHKIKPVATQIPIGNIPDLHKRLHDYRKILFRNSKNNNRASLVLI